MNVLGHEVPDEVVVGAPAAVGAMLGWFGRQRTAAKRAGVDDRRVSLDEFSALVRAYEREMARLAADMAALKTEMSVLHAQNVALERENIALRSEVARLRDELGRMAPTTRAGRRETDPEVGG